MQLLADRFIVRDEPANDRDSAANGWNAIDLSTGNEVLLICTRAIDSDQTRWAVRCDFFNRLHHRLFARLVDYGPLDGVHRFEAWRCGLPRRGAPSDPERVAAAARSFLRANHLTTGDITAACLRDWHGTAVVLPHRDSGYAKTSQEASTENLDIQSCGITLIERRATSAIGEMLAAPGSARPRPIALFAEPGAGAAVAIADLARIARMNGLIPICGDFITPHVLSAIQGRTLCIFDRLGGTAGWRRLLEAALRSPKPHVVISVGGGELPGARTLPLEPITEAALIRAIRPVTYDGEAARRIERAARRARGLPGLFSRALWGVTSSTVPRQSRWPPHVALPRMAPSRAAEQPAVYAEELVPPLRRRLDSAIALIERGRHAPGDRAVRSVVGSLARRQDWDGAVCGSLALATGLLKRGHVRDAEAALEEARQYGEKAGDIWLQRVAIATGTTYLELGRLDEAENVLQSAYAMSRSIDEAADIVPGTLALARCLFWRGKYDDADAALERVDTSGKHPASFARLAALRSRIAAGRGELRSAIAHATIAIEHAKGLQDPEGLADAAAASALAHLRASDPRGVQHDVALSLQAAHRNRDPLAALKVRVILAEQERRAGRAAATRLLAARGRRLSLPATLRARLALVAELASGAPVADIVNRHTSATGFKALALFAPCEGDEHRAHVAVHAAVDILQLCQAAEEEQSLLSRVCARIRERLEASGVAIYGADGGSVVQIASDGSRMDDAIAKRVAGCRQLIPPHQHNERLEGGSPIRYGGDLVGVVVARWTICARPNPSQTQMLLTMAAPAVGPAVAAALARRRQAAAGCPGELLGTSAAMAEVRRAVDRAAHAPFAVLIEGESGSGKELVARALHRRSSRRDRPFCTLNCAALPEDLVEAELFGHGRGAFTGAVAERTGVFEAAHTGTLFLDEIAELSPRAQAKILRTLQEGEVRRVGENVARRIDVRIVSATNRDLREDVAANRFRLDLLYRLDVIRIGVPPLRERSEDIAVLAEHFWHEATARLGSRATLSAATLGALSRYLWPGNVRELQNVLAALAVRSPKRGVVPPSALPPVFTNPVPAEACRLIDARRTFEEQFVRAALVRTGGHRGRAAEELGVTRQGLVKLMTRLQIAD